MKDIQRVFFLLAIVISSNANGQLWKEYADSAKAYKVKKNTDKEIEFYYRTKAELKKDSVGTNSYANLCDTLAIFFLKKRQYEEAEPLFLEAKQVRETLSGKDNPEYASECYNLAVLYRNTAQYEKAEPLYLQAKNIREVVLGKNNVEYARSCFGLAFLYHNTGQFEKAYSLYSESKQIRERISGKKNIDYAQSCNSLANLYCDMEKYENAEPLYKEARQIIVSLQGNEGPDYATNCNNLAILYKDMGDYKKAEPLYLEAMALREKTLGISHPDYAASCNNLANLYKKMGEYEKAETLYKDARQIWGQTLSKEHPNYALGCNNLANLYIDMGQYDKAESLHLESIKIRGKILGKQHPDYAQSCTSLGALYADIAQYEKAEPLLLEALEVYQQKLGKENTLYTTSYKNLGNLFWITGNNQKAIDFFAEALNSQKNQIKKIFQFASETEQQSYLMQIGNLNDKFFSFSYSGYSKNPQGITYDVSIIDRNLILSSNQQLRQAIYNSNDTIISNNYNDWTSAREQLAFWYTKPIAVREKYIKILEEKANALEKNLTRFSSEFKKQQQQQELSWKNIKQNLKIGEAAIEFIEFEYYNSKRWTDSTYYIALLLRKDTPEPELIKLFEKRQLDSMLTYKSTSAGQVKLSYLYTKRQDGKANSLYDLIWKPIEQKLTGINTVYFAPAGSLYKISFAALPVSKTEVLSDKYRLVQLNTTASVGDNPAPNISASDKIILYGGVQYDADSTSIRQAALKYSANDVATRSLPDDLLRDGVGEFYYLSGSENEVTAIRKLATQNKYSATISDGMLATEESFKTLTGKNSPAILHIATHGFFFPDPKNEKKDDRMGGAIVFKQSDNPLIRSGLALAGANNAWKGKPVTGVEDGILTSYEVSNMYLPNTKLAVLSACETGLGDIQGSEGVYGLQRAFKMAGVQNLVMSLWKVDDMATSEFMQEFYKNLFAKKTINDAFYQAQTMMKNKYRNDPYKWAAWVLIR
jgi:CHAT domain-containing protein